MQNIFWSFGRRFDSRESFVQAVSEYNDTIRPAGDHGWEPERVIADGKIRVVFEAMWKDVDDTIDLNIGAEGSPLTIGEVLWQLNQSTADFWGNHPGFFEGLSSSDGHTFKMWIGS